MTWKSRPRCTRHHGLDFGNRSRDRSPRDATVGGDDEVILETDAPHGSTRIDPIFNKVLLDVRIISERFVQQNIYEVASRFNRETITFFQNGRGSDVEVFMRAENKAFLFRRNISATENDIQSIQSSEIEGCGYICVDNAVAILQRRRPTSVCNLFE